MRCAHVVRLNATAEHPTPVRTIATTASEVSEPKPSMSAIGTDSAAIVASCTAVRRMVSTRSAYAPINTNQNPKSTAVTSVTASPKPSVGSAPVSRKSPSTDMPTATQIPARGAWRNAIDSMIGVVTANRPVMNAEFDVVVCCKPRFWQKYAPVAIAPITTPPTTTVRRESSGLGRGPRQPRRSANGASTAAPTAKRNTFRPDGVRSSSASCTIVKVDP